MLYIYLMRAGNKHYKVGVTHDLVKRVKGIQTSNPAKVEVVTSKLAEVPFAVEHELHQRLVKTSTGGGTEWFTLTPEQAIELCIHIQNYPHIELNDRVIVKDLLTRQLMWKKTVEKKLDLVLNNYQKAVVRTIERGQRPTSAAESEQPKLPQPTPDELDADAYRDAIEVVRREGKASTSLLQRRLKIGYGRAARMMDQLEEDGIIGGPVGNRPRVVIGQQV